LGEQYSEEKLICKTLRSLPSTFHAKVAAIEQYRNISKMRLDELIGSLQTYEMSLKSYSKYKEKVMALKVEDDFMMKLIL
jgi:hypothetical protein